MYISTKTGYALRALIELAMAEAGKPLSIKELALRQQLPAKYMERLFSLMKKAGLVTSRKGTQGGYLLNHAANEISLHQIMVAVEESDSHTYCRYSRFDKGHCLGTECQLKDFWNTIGEDLEGYFSQINIEDIIKKYMKRSS